MRPHAIPDLLLGVRVKAPLTVLCASILLASGFPLSAQTPSPSIVLAAGAEVVIFNTAPFNPKAAKVGDTLDFRSDHDLRVGYINVLPKGTLLHAHVTEVRPKTVLALDPTTANGSVISFSGQPFANRAYAKADQEPTELATHHPPVSGGEIAADVAFAPVIAAIGVPGLAIALPVRLIMAAHPRHKVPEIPLGTRSVVRIASKVTFPTDSFPIPVYTGMPIVYVLHRYTRHNDPMFCGAEPLPFGDRTDLYVRLPAGSYAFRTGNPGDTAVALEAHMNGRYLVFRDRTGIHIVDLSTRPDLLEALPPAKQTLLFSDYQSAPPLVPTAVCRLPAARP